MNKLNLSQEELAFDQIEKAFNEGKINSDIYIDSLGKIVDYRNSIEKAQSQLYSDTIIFNEKGEILFLERNGQDSFEGGKLCLPGGKVEGGENIEAAAIRELKEETSIDLDASDMRFLTEHKNTDGSTSFYFQSIAPKNSVIVLDNNEHYRYKWLKPEELKGEDFIFDLGERLINLLAEHGGGTGDYSGSLFPSIMKFINNILDRSKRKTDYCGCVVLKVNFSGLEALHNLIDPEDVYTEEEGFGLESDPHITALYGIHKMVPFERVVEVCDVIAPEIGFSLSGVDFFCNDKYDVLKFNVKSESLEKLNAVLKQLPYQNDYPIYKPHMTIAYLKKGLGKKYMDILKDLEVVRGNSSQLVYSHGKGTEKQSLDLMNPINDAGDIVQKAFDNDTISSGDYFMSMDFLEKAKKDTAKLKKVKKIAYRNGKAYIGTYYVKGDEFEAIKDEGFTETQPDAPETHVGQHVRVTKKSGKVIEGKVSYLYHYDKDDSLYIDYITNEGKKKSTKFSTVDKFEVYEPEKAHKIASGDKNGYTVIKTLGGSTGALLVEKDGIKFVKKTAANPDHLANEVRSLKYAAQAGMPVPAVAQYVKGEAVYLEFIGGKTLREYMEGASVSDKDKMKEKISEHFVMNALMANHDAVGMNYDNIMVDDKDNPVFVDLGGAMKYRAQGEIKESWENWKSSDVIEELNTMTDANVNLQAATIFGQVVNEGLAPMIAQQLQKIKGNNPDWISGNTDGSKKLAERFKKLYGQFSDDIPESLKKIKEDFDKEEDKEPNYAPGAFDLVKNLYKKEFESAKSTGRTDIMKFYSDLPSKLAMTVEEKEEAKKKWGDYDGYNTSNFLNENPALSNEHAKALNRHSQSSTVMNRVYENLLKGDLTDKYNINLKEKKEIGEIKDVDFNSFTENFKTEDSIKERILLAKLAVEAFSLLKSQKNKNKAWRQDVTLYRGVDAISKDSKNTFFKGETVYMDCGISSNSDNIHSSFDRDTKIVSTAASGISIIQVSSHDHESEVVTKPYELKQITASKISGKEGFSKKGFVRQEPPGMFPIDLD